MGAEERRINNVAEYRQELLAIAELWRSPVLAFRGQKDRDWLLESSAERRLKKGLKGQDRILDNLFIEYHRDNLLQTGKLRNYDKREGNQLADLELLADLQHHGAATCLLDFTRNALVALWFACEDSHRESGGFDQETAEGLGESPMVLNDGKVFVVNIANERGGFQEITPRDIADQSIENVLRFKTRDEGSARERTDQESLKSSSDEAKFWYWTPAHLNERITAQGSLFLFAPPSSGQPNSEDIVVAAECKGQIRKELEDLYNTQEESLFPDFVGFAYTQRHDAPIYIPDSEEYRRRGIEADRRGEEQQALEHYTKAIELRPEDSDTYFRRGRVHYETGSHDLAIQDFNKSLELDPNNAVVYISRAFVYDDKGDHHLAIRDYDNALKLDPDNPRTYLLRALAYDSRGDDALVIQDCNKSLELDPEDALAYRVRGNAYGRQGELNRAIQDFDKSIELDPDNDGAYFNRGYAHYRTGESDLAIQDFNKALDLDPDNVDAYCNRGSVHYRRGEYEVAIKDFNKALDLDPDNVDAYFNRGLANFDKGELDIAIKDFNKALDLDPHNADAHVHRGNIYYKTGEFDLAVQNFNKALDLDPDNVETYFYRSFAYNGKGELDLAIQDIEKILTLSPKNDYAYFYRGWAYYATGEYDLAIQDFYEALALDPDKSEAYYYRGLAHKGKGELDLAIQDFDKAVALKPDDTQSYFSRGLVWLCLLKWKEAKSDLTSAKSKGLDITTAFSDMYRSVEDFEQKHGVKLPPVIASMLSTKPESTEGHRRIPEGG